MVEVEVAVHDCDDVRDTKRTQELVEQLTLRVVDRIDELVAETHPGVDEDRAIRVLDAEAVDGNRGTPGGCRMCLRETHGREI